jgi:thiamine kinase-like enzyme
MRDEIFAQCRDALPGWAHLTVDDVTFDAPKGFSSFTMTLRVTKPAEPAAIFYRRLEGKENAILPTELEREVFLLLGENGIAAHCPRYEERFRLEACYDGRTLTRDDLLDLDVLRRIAGQLHRFHRLEPRELPADDFFTLLHRKWGPMADRVLHEQLDVFPEQERTLGVALREITSEETRAKVRRFLPDSPLTFCHNDTYHGNVMRLDSGEIKLLDFEFSCRNHKAFDFSNLFAETVMRHGLAEYPHFRIAEPEYGDRELRGLIGAYVANDTHLSAAERESEVERLVAETRQMIPLSHYMYAMAAIPLAVEPIQKIRFLPYAHMRFTRFLDVYRQRYEDAVRS